MLLSAPLKVRALLATLVALLMVGIHEEIGAKSRYLVQVPTRAKVIVFVHGVVGNADSTWTNSQTNAYWPRLVATDQTFADANVYVFEYPTPPLGKSLSINELAEAMRRRLEADDVLQHAELIFLSHSMGGLVTRAFLLKYREQAAKTKFSYFFATPTEGSPTALLASLASRNAQFRGMYPMSADSYLADLQRDWLAAKLGIRSFCAYEGKTTFGVLIVDQRSASNLCTEPLDPIAEDHILIAKPSSRDADSYIAFKNAYRAVGRDGGVVPRADRSKTDHPYIEPGRPMASQVQLFAEDKVRFYGERRPGARVWVGGEWESLSETRQYVVVGVPGRPIVPKFDPMPSRPFKLEVEYEKFVDSPRDLRNAGAQTLNPAALATQIRFAKGSATLDESASNVLIQLAEATKGITLEVIIITGSADITEGSRAVAEGLARRRAQVVRDFLSAQGIEKNRLYVDSKIVAQTKDSSLLTRAVEVEAVQTRLKK